MSEIFKSVRPDQKKMVEIPEERPGMIKTPGEISSSHEITSGGVAVYNFPSIDRDPMSYIFMSPVMNQSTLLTINRTLNSLSDPATKAQLHHMISQGLPKIEFLVGDMPALILEGNKIGVFIPGYGFEKNSRYFQDNPHDRGFQIPGTNGEPQRFVVYRKLQSFIQGKEHLFTITYEMPSVDGENLNTQIAELLQKKDYSEKDLRKIMNVRLDIETLGDLQDSDGSGGENVNLKNPRRDDGGSGVKA